MGDIYITTLSTNPATRFLGTTWQKIEGRFLLATSGSNASGQIGGSNTKTIAKANLPNAKLQVDAVSATIPAHTHDVSMYAYYDVNEASGGFASGSGGIWRTLSFKTTSSGSGNTGTIAPYTNPLGSGTPLDITPAYYTVHVWKRLS